MPRPSSRGHYVTVLRASAAIRIPPDEEVTMRIVDGPDTFLVTVRTRYRPVAGLTERLPRELWVEVVGPGTDVYDAMRRADQRANTIACAMALAMNAGVDRLAVELCFDVSPDRDEHDFFQNCMPDETGYPRAGRKLDDGAFIEFMSDVLAHARRDRLLRAIAHYDQALQQWLPGRETLVLGYLYVAMEALTPIALEREIDRRGGREALIKAWNVEPVVCRQCGTKVRDGDLDHHVRKHVLFRGEEEVYRDARAARVGFQHAHKDLGTVHEQSVRHIDRLALLVRHAVMDLVSEDAPWRDVLLADSRDSVVLSAPVAKYIRCSLVGNVENLAPEDEQYPRFELRSSIKSVSIGEDGKWSITPDEKATAFIGEGVEGRGFRFEVWGPEGLTAYPTAPTAP